MAREDHDKENLWRCPMLGGPVPFKHCRETNNGLPCHKVPECWSKRFDTAMFLSDNYTEDELKSVFSPQPDRLERILGMLVQRNEGKDGA